MRDKSKLKCILWSLMLGVLIAASVNRMMEGHLSDTEGETTEIYRNYKFAKANQIETLHKLLPESWEKLDFKSRVNVLEVTANVLGFELGLPYELTVITTDWQDEARLGQYNDEKRLIELSSELVQFGEVYDVLLALCHEVHHSYAHRLSEVYEEVRPEHKSLTIFQEAEMYYNDLANYVNAADNYSLYEMQVLEWHAHQYSTEQVKSIYAFIELTGGD